MNEKIAANLKRLRKARKLSKQRAADMLGVSRTTYAHWETGSEIKLCNAVKLAQFHKCSIEDLIK